MPGGACNFDKIAGKHRDGAEISIGTATLPYDAWAALDTQAGLLAQSVVVQLVGQTSYELKAPKTKRPDVADYFKNPKLIDAGFGGDFSAQKVPPGSYELRVLMETAEGKWLQCLIVRKVTVVAAS